jgi:ribonuclease D
LPESKIRLTKKLKNWKEKKAAELDIDPALVLNKSQAIDIAKSSPAAIRDLDDIASLKSWQIREFGEDIIRCINP